MDGSFLVFRVSIFRRSSYCMFPLRYCLKCLLRFADNTHFSGGSAFFHYCSTKIVYDYIKNVVVLDSSNSLMANPCFLQICSRPLPRDQCVNWRWTPNHIEEQNQSATIHAAGFFFESEQSYIAYVPACCEFFAICFSGHLHFNLCRSCPTGPQILCSLFSVCTCPAPVMLFCPVVRAKPSVFH